MAFDFVDELENKVDKLINSFQKIKTENEEKDSRIVDLERENKSLKGELNSHKNESIQKHEQFESASEKIKNLIAKLETVE